MNSQFKVSDVSANCPIDWGAPAVMRVPQQQQQQHNSKKGASGASGEQFRLFVEPKIVGRRVDPNTRIVYPTLDRLNMESHSIDLTMEPVTKALLARERKSGASGLKRRVSQDSVSAAAAVKVPEKRIKVLRPQIDEQQPQQQQQPQRQLQQPQQIVAPSAAATTATTATSQQPAQQQSTSLTSDTVLVRLSSGRMVRISKELLLKHQRINQTQNEDRLSRLLKKIQTGQTQQQQQQQQLTPQQQQQQQQQPRTMTSPRTETATEIVNRLVSNGRLPQPQRAQPPVAPVQSQTRTVLQTVSSPDGSQKVQHRLIKIRANPGVVNGITLTGSSTSGSSSGSPVLIRQPIDGQRLSRALSQLPGAVPAGSKSNSVILLTTAANTVRLLTTSVNKHTSSRFWTYYAVGLIIRGIFIF